MRLFLSVLHIMGPGQSKLLSWAWPLWLRVELYRTDQKWNHPRLNLIKSLKNFLKFQKTDKAVVTPAYPCSWARHPRIEWCQYFGSQPTAGHLERKTSQRLEIEIDTKKGWEVINGPKYTLFKVKINDKNSVVYVNKAPPGFVTITCTYTYMYTCIHKKGIDSMYHWIFKIFFNFCKKLEMTLGWVVLRFSPQSHYRKQSNLVY